MFQCEWTTLGWFHNDGKLLAAHDVVVWKKQLSPSSQFVSPMLFSPNLPITSPNNEQHNLENKDFENEGLEGRLHPKHVQSIIYKNLYNVVDSNGFDVSTQCITYVMGILSFPSCVNGTYEYIATWTNKHYLQQWMSCNIVPTIRINGCFIFVNHILCPLGYLFGQIHLGLL